MNSSSDSWPNFYGGMSYSNNNLIFSGYSHQTSSNSSFGVINLDGNTFDFESTYEIMTIASLRIVEVLGCTNDFFSEYNPEANVDDGSCQITWQGLAYLDMVDSLQIVNQNLVEESILLQNEFNNLETEAISSLSSLQQALNTWNTTINLSAGWNMFGYGCPNPIDVAEGLSNHTESIIIVKDNNGNLYMPEFGFNGLGDLISGFGYKIKVTEAIESFSLCDWYLNDIPEDNIITLQEENAYLQDSLISMNNTDCIEYGFCGFDVSFNDCYYPEQGYYCNGDLFPEVGDLAFGGIVFYIDSDGNGLVAASFDAGVVPWGCYGSDINGANGEQVGDGYQNTIDIIGSCSETPIAASISLEFETIDYIDWYLPSQQELSEMYYSIGNGSPQGNIGYFNLIVQGYWSSTKENISGAWVFNFWDGSTNPIGKNNLFAVRPIRSF